MIKFLLITSVNILVLLGILEVILYCFISYGTAFPSFSNALRGFYNLYELPLVHFDKRCAEHDSKLGYKFKQGSCSFKSREFSFTFSSNSKGFRDSEESLQSPEIVFLGDSSTWGWGVNSEESFPQLIGARTNLKTLNTGVPSYGTIREFEVLKQLDRSKLKWLIIQYSANDEQENISWFKNRENFKTMSSQKYDQLVKDHKKQLKYFFGKYSFRLLPLLIRLKVDWKQDFLVKVDNRADIFVEILKQHQAELEGVKIVILDMSGRDSDRTKFIQKLRPELINLDPQFSKNISTIDIYKNLSKDDFFNLDDHINNLGHQKVAERLCQILPCS